MWFSDSCFVSSPWPYPIIVNVRVVIQVIYHYTTFSWMSWVSSWLSGILPVLFGQYPSSNSELSVILCHCMILYHHEHVVGRYLAILWSLFTGRTCKPLSFYVIVELIPDKDSDVITAGEGAKYSHSDPLFVCASINLNNQLKCCRKEVH
jgi:hypothetical protein